MIVHICAFYIDSRASPQYSNYRIIATQCLGIRTANVFVDQLEAWVILSLSESFSDVHGFGIADPVLCTQWLTARVVNP